MDTYVWLVYDFVDPTINRDFFAWLNSRGALECGKNVAFFKYNCFNLEQICGELLTDLKRTVSFSDGDRLYCVTRNQNGAYVGRFILGVRHDNPWRDYRATDVNS